MGYTLYYRTVSSDGSTCVNLGETLKKVLALFIFFKSLAIMTGQLVVGFKNGIQDGIGGSSLSSPRDEGGRGVVHCSKLLLEAVCHPQDHDKSGSTSDDVGSSSRARNESASQKKEITVPE
ncbi:hypothetical protein Tco_1318692 [Tanacetum coccineum]